MSEDDYLIDLEQGQFFEAEIHALSGDIAVSLEDQRRHVVFSAVTSDLDGSAVLIALVAGGSGRHRLKVSVSGASPGKAVSYRLDHGTLRRPLPRDDLKLQAVESLGRGRQLLGSVHGRSEAARSLEAALSFWHQLGNRLGESQANALLGQLALKQKEHDIALWRLVRTADLATRAGRIRQEAASFRRAGDVEWDRREFSKAYMWYAKCLSVATQSKDARRLQAGCMHDLASASVHLQNQELALTYYQKSLALRVLEGWSRQETLDTLKGLAVASHEAGLPKQALRYFGQAEALSSIEDTDIVCGKGRAYLQSEKWRQGEDSLRRCVELQRTKGDLIWQCRALNLLGNLYLSAGRPEQAQETYEKAVELSLSTPGDCHSEAKANLARIDLLRKTPQVEKRFEEIAKDLTDPLVQIWLKVDRARAALIDRDCDTVWKLIEQTESEIEKQRTGPKAIPFRRDTLGKLRSLYELRVETLMDSACREARSDGVAQAFGQAESSRARTLLDEIHERGATSRGVLTGAARTFTLEEIQRRLLDEESVLLYYFLGKQKSFLWLVRRNFPVLSYEIPSADKLGHRVRDLHAAWSTSPFRPGKKDNEEEREVEREAIELSKILLGEVTREIAGKRLLVVTDGDLQSLPFAALPNPSDPAHAPLVAEHEVVHLPSASFLLYLQERKSGKPKPDLDLALFADPQFTPPPVVEASSGRRPFRVSEPVILDPLPLPHTREEAQEILKLFPARNRVFLALGSNATFEQATTRHLRRFSILHFATHGVMNPEAPELSGLELARYDAMGRRNKQGTLFAWQIQQMNLGAELVVLSACKTALGRMIAGEGMIGLSRAFFNAGASRVVVSLWNVEDDSTAQLMPLFYQELKGGISPSAALRKAQNHLRQIPGYEHPYHWAAFIHEGDWRPLNKSILSVSSLGDVP